MAFPRDTGLDLYRMRKVQRRWGARPRWSSRAWRPYSFPVDPGYVEHERKVIDERWNNYILNSN